MVVLAATCIGFLILATAFASVFLSSSAYEKIPAQFQEENSAVLDSLTSMPLAYASPAFLDEREAAHMADVKLLFDIGIALGIAALGIALGIAGTLAFRGKRAQLEELLVRASVGAGWSLIGLGALLGLTALLSFDRFWVLFHVILFPQGGWLFSPESVLIRMYPSSFFAAFAQGVLVRAMVAGALLVVVGSLVQRMAVEEREFKERAAARRGKR
jgi:integral membrane protein (TIGR01906 family)